MNISSANTADPALSIDPGHAARVTDPAPMVAVHELNRVFGTVHAVRDLSFSIPRGGVVGFIGANGAGKTTTMRIMATLDDPTSGHIVVGGLDVVEHPREIRRLVGWMPDALGTYQTMTVFEYLDFFARSYGFSAQQRRERIEEVEIIRPKAVVAEPVPGSATAATAAPVMTRHRIRMRPRVRPVVTAGRAATPGPSGAVVPVVPAVAARPAPRASVA
jgi:ABC-2 type transport system ATP-binding protein